MKCLPAQLKAEAGGRRSVAPAVHDGTEAAEQNQAFAPKLKRTRIAVITHKIAPGGRRRKAPQRTNFCVCKPAGSWIWIGSFAPQSGLRTRPASKKENSPSVGTTEKHLKQRQSSSAVHRQPDIAKPPGSKIAAQGCEQRCNKTIRPCIVVTKDAYHARASVINPARRGVKRWPE